VVSCALALTLGWVGTAQLGYAQSAPRAGSARPYQPPRAQPRPSPVIAKAPAPPDEDRAVPPPEAGAATSVPAPLEPVQVGDSAARLRDLERRVVQLKEQVFRSKARLNLLKETVMHGTIGSSRTVIRHVNKMGGSFKLVRATYGIDGQLIFSRLDDTGELDETKEFEVFAGSIVPGNHTITVVLVFVGNDYGALTYMQGYKYTVRASHTFLAGENRVSEVSVVAFERGNMTTAFKDKPAIDFRVKTELEARP
jgi:hypothetical protein